MASSPDNKPAAMPSRPGSDPGAEIPQQLEHVLRNLNINLEDELTRYRRQRHGRVAPPPPPRRAVQRKTIDLISISASPHSSHPSPTVAEQGASSETAAGENPSQPSTSPPPPPPNPFLKATSIPTENSTSSNELKNKAVETDSLTEHSSASAVAPILTETDNSALPIHTTDTSPEGYLESSAELLKNIAQEQAELASVPEPYSPEHKNNGLLKLAGLVLVLLAGIGVGFAITYPSQLQNLRSQIWSTEPESETTTGTNEARADEATTIPTTKPAAETTLDGYEPSGPDLSTREFKDLNSVKDLVTLDIETSSDNRSIPSIPPNPGQSSLPPPTNEQVPSALINPETNSTRNTPETTLKPTTTPTTSTPAAPTPPPLTPTTGSNFYIVASYTGDASLNKARELVPDAFVRNFKAGARIQLAAFDNRAQAAKQIEFLTRQGVTVELFGPTNE